MKLVITKENLLKGVNIVSKAVPSKTTMSILECILIDATKDCIRFVANDMELGIQTIVKGDILEKGCVAYDAKFFTDMVKKLEDGDITIECDDNFKTKIKSEKDVYNISGRDSEGFSDIPSINRDDLLVVSQFSLRELVSKTIFSTSDNEANKALSGELFEIKNGNFRVMSLDGQRVSIRNVEIDNSEISKKIIVPAKSLNELLKIINGGENDDITLFFMDNHLVFEFDDTTVVTRLIEGEYLNIDNILSSDYETKIEINRKELYNHIDRATVILREGDKKPIIMNIEDDKIELKMVSSTGYDYNGKIDLISKDGVDMKIGFNPKFVIDALKVIDDEEIKLYFVNPKAPCFIKDDNGSYIYLVLPVNFVQDERQWKNSE